MENNTKQKKNSDVEVGLIVVSVAILVAFIILMIFTGRHAQRDHQVL